MGHNIPQRQNATLGRRGLKGGHERRLLQQTAVGRFPLWFFGDRGGVAVQYVVKGHKADVPENKKVRAVLEALPSDSIREIGPGSN
jgi:hypothetical protein